MEEEKREKDVSDEAVTEDDVESFVEDFIGLDDSISDV
jgi:hypothetical protein